MEFRNFYFFTFYPFVLFKGFITNNFYVSHSVVSHLFATPWTVACQAPLSMEFSKQEY